MTMLMTILALSGVMWYLIDRLKMMWSDKSYGKYITMAVSAVFGFGLTFAFGLDILFALGIVEVVSIAGQLLTGAALMSGSSAISEIIAAIKGSDKNDNKNA